MSIALAPNVLVAPHPRGLDDARHRTPALELRHVLREELRAVLRIEPAQRRLGLVVEVVVERFELVIATEQHHGVQERDVHGRAFRVQGCGDGAVERAEQRHREPFGEHLASVCSEQSLEGFAHIRGQCHGGALSYCMPCPNGSVREARAS